MPGYLHGIVRASFSISKYLALQRLGYERDKNLGPNDLKKTGNIIKGFQAHNTINGLFNRLRS